MLDLIDESLEGFFRATVPLGAPEIDVSFEPPEREWSAKLTRPTVNVFLWDIRRSTERARTGTENLERDGRLVRRMALPRIELRYLVTAWTSDHGDERALLGGLLRAILAHSEVPQDYVAEELHELPAIGLVMARAGEEHIDVFKALEGQLKPGINLVVHSAVDIGVVTPAGPPTELVEIGMVNRVTGLHLPRRRRVAGEVAASGAVGARVRTPRGSTRVNATGRFLVAAEPGDEVVVETDPPLSAVVPANGGIRIGGVVDVA
jgi:hypothetical protein